MASPAVLSVPSPAESICHRPTPGLKNNPSRPAGSYRPDWLSYLDKVMGDGGSEEPAATSGHTGARARAVASWAEIVHLASAAASSAALWAAAKGSAPKLSGPGGICALASFTFSASSSAAMRSEGVSAGVGTNSVPPSGLACTVWGEAAISVAAARAVRAPGSFRVRLRLGGWGCACRSPHEERVRELREPPPVG